MILTADPQLWKIGQEGVPPVISGFSTGSQGIPASTKISNPEQIAAFMIFNRPPLEFKCCRTSCGLEMSWVFESQDVFSIESQKVTSNHLPISLQGRLPSTRNFRWTYVTAKLQVPPPPPWCFPGGHFPGKQGANVIGATFDKWLGGFKRHPNWSNHSEPIEMVVKTSYKAIELWFYSIQIQDSRFFVTILRSVNCPGIKSKLWSRSGHMPSPCLIPFLWESEWSQPGTVPLPLMLKQANQKG